MYGINIDQTHYEQQVIQIALIGILRKEENNTKSTFSPNTGSVGLWSILTLRHDNRVFWQQIHKYRIGLYNRYAMIVSGVTVVRPLNMSQTMDSLIDSTIIKESVHRLCPQRCRP